MRLKRVRNALNAKGDKHSRGANIECLAASNLLVRAKVLLSFALVTWSALCLKGCFEGLRYTRAHAALRAPSHRPLSRPGAVAVRRRLRRPERRIRSRRLQPDRGRAKRRALDMGHQSRRRHSELRRVRLCNVARTVPDLHRPVVPPHAHACRPARAAGRKAGTAAPGAGKAIAEPSPPTQPYDRANDILPGPCSATNGTSRSGPAN